MLSVRNNLDSWVCVACVVVLLLLAGGEAIAQSTPGQALRPVDQAVEDVDPHAASRRYIDTGNATLSPRSRMFRIDPERSGVWTPNLPLMTAERFPYMYRGRGVQAIAPRADYLVLQTDRMQARPHVAINKKPRRDGEFLELMSAGTVFNLIPNAGEARGETPDQQSAPRVVGRFDSRVDGRYRVQQLELTPAGPQTFPPPPPPRRVLRSDVATQTGNRAGTRERETIQRATAVPPATPTDKDAPPAE